MTKTKPVVPKARAKVKTETKTESDPAEREVLWIRLVADLQAILLRQRRQSDAAILVQVRHLITLEEPIKYMGFNRLYPVMVPIRRMASIAKSVANGVEEPVQSLTSSSSSSGDERDSADGRSESPRPRRRRQRHSRSPSSSPPPMRRPQPVRRVTAAAPRRRASPGSPPRLHPAVRRVYALPPTGDASWGAMGEQLLDAPAAALDAPAAALDAPAAGLDVPAAGLDSPEPAIVDLPVADPLVESLATASTADESDHPESTQVSSRIEHMTPLTLMCAVICHLSANDSRSVSASCQTVVVDLFRQPSIDLNLRSQPHGWTPLFFSVHGHHAELVRALLGLDATRLEVDHVFPSGHSLLHHALVAACAYDTVTSLDALSIMLGGHGKCTDLLTRGLNPWSVNDQGMTALEMCRHVLTRKSKRIARLCQFDREGRLRFQTINQMLMAALPRWSLFQRNRAQCIHLNTAQTLPVVVCNVVAHLAS